jgi:hypothetical protein
VGTARQQQFKNELNRSALSLQASSLPPFGSLHQ